MYSLGLRPLVVDVVDEVGADEAGATGDEHGGGGAAHGSSLNTHSSRDTERSEEAARDPCAGMRGNRNGA